MESAVSESTTNILWESACFDATAVRLTAQRHGLRTDASTRYEKSLDPILAGTTFPRVVEYLNFLGKNIVLGGISHFLDTTRVNSISLDVEYSFINMKAGTIIPKEEVDGILTRLGFKISVPPGNTALKKIQSMDAISDVFQEKIHIEVPTWRASKDINIKEDIAEEVARVYGYDKTPLTALG
jgi:phenylalanyl-tRNA synthetase beta chain